MANIIGGLIIGIVAIFILSIAVTMTASSIQQNRQSGELNCVGFTHPTDGSLSYNSSLETNTSACVLNASIIPFYILGAVVTIFLLIVYGTGATPLEPGIPRI